MVKHSKRFIAVDIVTELIAFNIKKFKEENEVFHCLDVAVDDFPFGDGALLRQVFVTLKGCRWL